MTPEEIKKWARFAQLKIADDEIKQYEDINNILEFFVQLKEVDVSQVTPLSNTSQMVQRLREDVPSDPSLHTEPMLYWVPAVFDDEA